MRNQVTNETHMTKKQPEPIQHIKTNKTTTNTIIQL